MTADKQLSHIELGNLIVNQLVAHGIVDVGLLYGSPFTDFSPTGPDDLFTSEQVNRIVELLETITRYEDPTQLN